MKKESLFCKGVYIPMNEICLPKFYYNFIFSIWETARISFPVIWYILREWYQVTRKYLRRTNATCIRCKEFFRQRCATGYRNLLPLSLLIAGYTSRKESINRQVSSGERILASHRRGVEFLREYTYMYIYGSFERVDK